MALCGNSSKSLHGRSIKSISDHALPIWCLRTLSLASHVCWIPRISDLSSLNTVHSRHCSLLSHLTLACPWLMGLMSDAGMCSDQWAADSREYRLLPSNTTRPNMHKTNAGLRAPAEGANCLCNKKADTFLLWLQRLSILSCLMQLTYSFAFFKTKMRSFLL